MKFRFPVVIIDEDYRSENTSGLGIRALAKAIEDEGVEILGVTSYGDLSSFAQQQSRASAFILSIDDEEFTPGPELDPAVLNLRQFIKEIRFRNADMLVIDDIHFLSKHEQTQEEFFHTFNALYQGGRQIVLSSDAAPSEIPDLEERLVSRFNCGLVARIDRPAYETRVAILRTKAALHDLQLPDDVPAYVAARIDSNIRELEGALARLRGMAMATGSPITLELAKQALSDGRPQEQRDAANQPTIQQIIEAVTHYYDIKLSDLMSKRRHKSVALPRQVCMWLARKHTRFSLEEIGGYFGGRDHTTVMHAVRTVGAKALADAALSSDVARIEQALRNQD